METSRSIGVVIGGMKESMACMRVSVSQCFNCTSEYCCLELGGYNQKVLKERAELSKVD